MENNENESKDKTALFSNALTGRVLENALTAYQPEGPSLYELCGDGYNLLEVCGGIIAQHYNKPIAERDFFIKTQLMALIAVSNFPGIGFEEILEMASNIQTIKDEDGKHLYSTPLSKQKREELGLTEEQNISLAIIDNFMFLRYAHTKDKKPEKLFALSFEIGRLGAYLQTKFVYSKIHKENYLEFERKLRNHEKEITERVEREGPRRANEGLHGKYRALYNDALETIKNFKEENDPAKRGWTNPNWADWLLGKKEFPGVEPFRDNYSGNKFQEAERKSEAANKGSDKYRRFSRDGLLRRLRKTKRG